MEATDIKGPAVIFLCDVCLLSFLFASAIIGGETESELAFVCACAGAEHERARLERRRLLPFGRRQRT